MDTNCSKIEIELQMHLQHNWTLDCYENWINRGRRDVQPVSHVLHPVSQGTTSNCNSQNDICLDPASFENNEILGWFPGLCWWAKPLSDKPASQVIPVKSLRLIRSESNGVKRLKLIFSLFQWQWRSFASPTWAGASSTRCVGFYNQKWGYHAQGTWVRSEM